MYARGTGTRHGRAEVKRSVSLVTYELVIYDNTIDLHASRTGWHDDGGG